jgi:hypothetical protein
MQTGPDVREDITFVGYFLKLMSFKSRDNKMRAAPLLIGRAIRHENAAAKFRQTEDEKNRTEFWITVTVGGVLVVMMLITGSRIFRRRKPAAALAAEKSPEDAQATDDWLINLPAKPSDAAPPPEDRHDPPPTP